MLQILCVNDKFLSQAWFPLVSYILKVDFSLGLNYASSHVFPSKVFSFQRLLLSSLVLVLPLTPKRIQQCRNRDRGGTAKIILSSTEESPPQFIMEKYRNTFKKNGLQNQIWIRESVTCEEGINTPTTSVLRRFLL